MFRKRWWKGGSDGPPGLNLALQGGGAHGAYTWGVLDRLLEDGWALEGISGTSAGAMNAVALAQGWTTGGGDGARESLARFWEAVADSTPLELDLLHSLNRNGAGALPAPMNMMLGLTRLFSPYEFNPFELNPLRDVVRAQFDFERIRRDCRLKLFVAATTSTLILARLATHGIQIDGSFLVDDFNAAGPYNEATTFDCKLQSSGQPTFTYS